MGILSRVLNFRASPESPTTLLSNPASWMYDAFGGGASEAGVTVTERSAMQLSAVATCVSILSGAIASLPLKVYRRRGRAREVARDHRLYRVLHDRPSLEDNSYQLRHKMTGNLLLWGNAYAEIIYDGAGRSTKLLHHPVQNVQIKPGAKREQFSYVVTEGQGAQRTIAPEDMIHLRGFCHEGLAGMSVVQNHRRTLGLSVAAEVFASHFYKNGARASGILMYPGRLGDKGKANLSDSFDEKHQGVENAHRTIILEEGTKYQQITVPPNDAQFIETRMLSRAEIAGIYRIPTMLVPGASTNAPTYAASESFMRYFADFSLRDWLTLWQAELNNKLFDGDTYSEFDLHDFLRADAVARAQLHKAMWEIGAKSANMVNDDENENPVPGGDRVFVPMNYVPADRVDDVVDAQTRKPEPSPAPAPPMDGITSGVKTTVPRGYRSLFGSWIRKVQAWEDFKAERAATNALPMLRAMADDIAPECTDAALREFSEALARRVRTITTAELETEFERAVNYIRERGGSDNGQA